jgi:hypothetical protein
MLPPAVERRHPPFGLGAQCDAPTSDAVPIQPSSPARALHLGNTLGCLRLRLMHGKWVHRCPLPRHLQVLPIGAAGRRRSLPSVQARSRGCRSRSHGARGVGQPPRCPPLTDLVMRISDPVTVDRILDLWRLLDGALGASVWTKREYPALFAQLLPAGSRSPPDGTWVLRGDPEP